MPIEVQHVAPSQEQRKIIRQAFPDLNLAADAELRRRKPAAEPEDLGLEQEDEDDYDEPSDYEDEDGPSLDGPSAFDELSPAIAALLSTILWLFPLTTLFIGLCVSSRNVTNARRDWAVHQQYRQDYTLHKLGSRVLNMLPGLSIYLYLTLRYPLSRFTQAALFLYSSIGGSYMVRLNADEADR